ncbi:hypothetical protein AGLY_011779 [Aphis glycines]|uniref:Uncharacterized protein n=1 Tax=Aphis glycines TaxID=307491 RepID=A0A6G0TB58_APHGL|nr:hypothetical protein AGLY_011779 [Aphis glycines]
MIYQLNKNEVSCLHINLTAVHQVTGIQMMDNNKSRNKFDSFQTINKCIVVVLHNINLPANTRDILYYTIQPSHFFEWQINGNKRFQFDHNVQKSIVFQIVVCKNEYPVFINGLLTLITILIVVTLSDNEPFERDCSNSQLFNCISYLKTYGPNCCNIGKSPVCSVASGFVHITFIIMLLNICGHKSAMIIPVNRNRMPNNDNIQELIYNLTVLYLKLNKISKQRNKN